MDEKPIDMTKTAPTLYVCKTDQNHYNVSFMNSVMPEDVVRMAVSAILGAANPNAQPAVRQRIAVEFAKALPSLLSKLGVHSKADEELRKQKKTVEALTEAVRSYGGNPEKILRNAGIEN